MMAEEKGAIPSEEKEVEELARAMCSFSKNTLCRECSDACFYKDYAKRAIDKGWRKQSENVIELPCKVGQTVYMTWEWKDTSCIAILTVERISITEAGQSIRTDLWSDDEDYWLAYNCGVFYFDDIGKTVFLTKEEAEAKMKGGAE